MKKIILLLIALVASFGMSAREIGRPLEVDTVIQMPNVTAGQIYAGAKTWLATAVVDSKSVIRLDDPVNHHLIGKSNIRLKVDNMMYQSLTGYIEFVLDVQAREGRMRVKIYGFEHKADNNPGPYDWDMGPVYIGGERPNAPKVSYKQMQKRAIPLIFKNVNQIINGLKSSAKTASVDDDW